MPKVKWIRDANVERDARKAGLEIEWVDIDFDKVDDRLSNQSQCRLEEAKINEDQMLGYAERMEQGHHFVSIVVVKIKNEKYVCKDGNHRRKAYELTGKNVDYPTIKAYVIKGSDDAIDLFTRSANAVTLSQTPAEKRIQIANHIKRCIETHTDSEIAAQFCYDAKAIARMRREIATEAEFEDFGLAHLNASQKKALLKLKANPELLVKVGNKTLAANLTGEETKILVDRLLASSSSVEQQDIIRSTQCRKKVSPGKSQPSRELRNILDKLKVFATTYDTPSKVGCTSNEMTELNKLATEAFASLGRSLNGKS